MTKTLLLSLGLLALAPAAPAQTAWPAAVAGNQPAASLSPRGIRLPADARAAPVSAVPAGPAAWSGAWRGWACRGFECDVGLVVEDVRGDEARIAFAMAATQLDLSQRAQARVVGNELQARLADNTTIHFRPRPDGHLDFLWRRHGDWVAGVLTRDDSTAEQRQQAAQRWLASDAFDVEMDTNRQSYTIRVRPKRGTTDFLGDAADECLYSKVPTRVAYSDPYVVMQFEPTLRGCDYRVQYRAHPVSGRVWAYRSEDGASWRQIAENAEIRLSR